MVGTIIVNTEVMPWVRIYLCQDEGGFIYRSEYTILPRGRTEVDTLTCVCYSG